MKNSSSDSQSPKYRTFQSPILQKSLKVDVGGLPLLVQISQWDIHLTISIYHFSNSLHFGCSLMCPDRIEITLMYAR